MNEVKEEPHIFDFKCGRIEAGHMWAEPKHDQASALYLDANFEKAFKIDDISSVFHYELIDDIGGMSYYVTEEGKGELRCGDLDGMLNEDKIADIHPTVCLRSASEDCILDVDFSKKVPELDYEFCEEFSFGNSSTVIHSPVTSNEALGTSESSIAAPKCVKNQIEKSTSGGLHDVSESKCGYEILIKDEMALKCSHTCDLQDVHETNDVQSALEPTSYLDRNLETTCFSLGSTKALSTSPIMLYDEVCPVSEDIEKDVLMDDLSTDSSSEVKIAIARQRRLCKPPQRYSEGWLKSRHLKETKCSTNSSKDKDLGVCSKRKHHRKTKASKVINSDLELDTDEEFDYWKSKKKSCRKKANNLWTLEEVVKLVDGIAQFGVGQWTAVQRAFFSSTRRTATDVRDKWRNLVKTNCKNSRSKRKDDQQQRNGAQPLPMAVIERVRELAIAHPLLKYASRPGSKASTLETS